MINMLNKNQIHYLLNNFENSELSQDLTGKYIYITGKSIVACDNSHGQAYTEEFKTLQQAKSWLNNEFEVDEQ